MIETLALAALTLAPSAPPTDPVIGAAVESCDVSHIVDGGGDPATAGIVLDGGASVIFPDANVDGIRYAQRASWEQMTCVAEALLPEFALELIREGRSFELDAAGLRVMVLPPTYEDSGPTVVIYQADALTS